MFVIEQIAVFSNDGAKLFFFPDENVTFQDSGKPLPQVTTELGDVKSNKSSDTDEDFIFIGDEAGSGLPVIKLNHNHSLKRKNLFFSPKTVYQKSGG